MKVFSKIYRYWIFCGCIYCTASMPKIDNMKGSKEGIKDAFEYEANLAEKQFTESLPVYKWTSNRVPFVISKEMSPNMTSTILEAINSWNKDFGNCIKWIPRRLERDYVYFTNGSFCHSEVGRVKYKQLIVLNEENCMGRGFILHEMMHAVGFTHEHNRADRDKYIEILFLNIPYEWRNQYKKESLDAMMELGPYDYYSVMHYEVQSPDRNKPAFRVIPKTIDVSKIGQRDVLSEMDKLKVKRLYCPSKL
ncbi:zinc metalloproteinase nas-13-like [Argiope bruennichi]|uniref:zinc metalloproteinase nas-13-like n=1 Tax=Argiope bruennichi TaxID=94029 RepID=UPI00249562F7|nr:zinc metalloproteinase nas-13-like [Argiope bruennichi]